MVALTFKGNCVLDHPKDEKGWAYKFATRGTQTAKNG